MKYQDESTKVSMVSVSRRALLPQQGQTTPAWKASLLISGLPEPSGTRSWGRTTGRSLAGTGTAPQLLAVDDGNRRAPVALAAHAPVAQTPGGFLLAQALGGQQFGHLVHRRHMGQAVEFAGIDADSALLVAVPVGPCLGAEGLAFDRDHLA